MSNRVVAWHIAHAVFSLAVFAAIVANLFIHNPTAKVLLSVLLVLVGIDGVLMYRARRRGLVQRGVR